MSQDRVNIRDVARACRLSKAAVSMALNNNPRISERTRAKVHAAAARLGFRVDPKLAQVMSAMGRRHAEHISAPIGIVSLWPQKAAWTETPGLRRFHSGLVERAAQLGCDTQEFWVGDPGMTPRRIEQILTTRGIEALIVLSYPTAPAVLPIDISPFAVSVLGRALVTPRVYGVDHDHHQGLFVALRELRERGYSRPALVITEDENERTMHCWVAAYHFEAYQLPARKRIPVWIVPRNGRRSGFKAWFQHYKPDVILGCNQLVTFLEDCGIGVPDDVAFATLFWMPHLPQFGGIDIRDEAIGGRAVEIVLDQLRKNERGIPEDPETVLIEGKWREGPSVRRRI